MEAPILESTAFGPFELDCAKCELRRDGAPVPISPRAFDLLAYLVARRSRVVPKTELIQKVWKVAALSRSAVPTCVAQLRRVLGESAMTARYIRTVPRKGYQFVGTISRTSRHSPHSQSIDFVGRNLELQLLGRSLIASHSEMLAGLTLLSGQAGIGKTRLLEEFAAGMATQGIAVGIGRCRETPGAPPLWPWTQIAHHLPLSKLGVDLRLSQPSSPSGDPNHDRFAFFDNAVRTLKLASQTTPLLLAIDDLHRADTASLRLLHFLLADPAPSRIHVLAAIREAENPSVVDGCGLLQSLSGLSRTTPIVVSPFSLIDIGELVTKLTGTTPAESTLQMLALQTGGNPFFLTQIIPLLDTHPSHRPMDNPRITLPSTVREIVLRLLDRYPSAVRTTLAAASVLGRDFSLATLAQAIDCTPTCVMEDLDYAQRRGLIARAPEDPNRYVFTHLLLRDALYDDLPPSRRQQLHLQIARALQQGTSGPLIDNAATLAYHFSEAIEVGGASEAYHFSVIAARSATQKLAFEDAPAHYRNALNVISRGAMATPRHYCETLAALGEAELAAQDRDAGRATILRAAALAKEMRDPDLIARTALSLAPGPLAIEVGVYDPQLVELLETAIADVEPANTCMRAKLLSRLCIALVWAGAEQRRRALSEEALHLAESGGDSETLAISLMARHSVLGRPEDSWNRSEVAKRLGDLVATTRKPSITLMYRLLRVTHLLERNELAALDTEIELYRKDAHAAGLPHFAWYCDLFEAMRALMTADFQRAHWRARRFFSVGSRVGDANAAHSFGAHRVIELWEAGDCEDAIAIARGYTARFPSVSAWRASLAMLLAEAGQTHEARREFEHLAVNGFKDIPSNEVWMTTMVILSQVCWLLRDSDRASSLYELLKAAEEYSAPLGFGVASFGSNARPLGLLAATFGDVELAVRHLEHAVDSDDRRGVIQWATRARCDLAEVLSSCQSNDKRRRARREAVVARRDAARRQMRSVEVRATAIASSDNRG